MFIQSFFEWKKKQFLSRKHKYLDKAKDWAAEGYAEDAETLLSSVEKLQRESEQISMHYLAGGNGFQKMMWWRIYCFWSDFCTLDDSIKSFWRQLLETIVFVGGGVFLVKRFVFSPYAVPSGSAEPNLLVGDRIIGLRYPYLFKAPSRGDLIIFDKPGFVYSDNFFARIYQKYIGFPLFGILPAGPDAWTKRVIGIPGDKIALKIDDQGRPQVWRNGALLNEPYLNPYPVIMLSRKKGFVSPKAAARNPLFNQVAHFFDLIEGYQDAGSGSKHMLYTYDPTKPYNQQPFYNFEESEIVKHPFSGRPIIFYPEQANPRIDRKAEFIVPEGFVFGLGDNRRNSYDCREFGLVSHDLIVGRASFIFFSLDGAETYWFVELLKNPFNFFTKKVRWSRFFRFVHPFKEIPKN